MKAQKIQSLKGMLCRDINGRVFIRTTAPNGSTTDYDVAHCDLQIEVKDDDAYIYQRGEKLVIDYSPSTLGINEKTMQDEHSDKK